MYVNKLGIILFMNRNKIKVIIKPTFECNLRCDYCYHSITDYEEGIMTEEILEKIICKIQERYSDVTYIWHGGEPLLYGLSFFSKAIELEKKYSNSTSIIRNHLQTNGTLISSKVLDFCQSNKITITISFDGPGELNVCRQGTELVENNIKKCINYGIKPSILAVINSYNVDRIIDTYNFAKEMKINIKFNPVFKTFEEDDSKYLLSSHRYSESILKLFDYWVFDIDSSIYVEPIMEYLQLCFKTGKGISCVYGSCLSNWLSFDFKGDIFPCGRNYSSEYCLGNINNVEQINQVFESEQFKNLLIGSILRKQYCSNNCEYYGLCNGGCNSNCLVNSRLDLPNLDHCTMFFTLFNHVKETIDVISDIKQEGRINPLLIKMLNDN